MFVCNGQQTLYKNLEALSYPIIQELIKEIRFYDPEHIEVIWNYQDDYMLSLIHI